MWSAAQAATPPPDVELAEKQTLTRALRGDPESLDPQLVTGIPGNHVTQDLFEGLVTQNLQGDIVPAQAESWETSADGKTWTFTLRKKLKWSDGQELTARDFEYGLRRLADPKTASTYAWYLEAMGIENAGEVISGKLPVAELGVKAISGHELQLRLAYPVPYLVRLLVHRAVSPIPRHAVDKFDRDWVAPENIVVNGAFKLQKRVVNERIVLQRNPFYWNDQHTVLETVTYLPLPSETAALHRYRAGEIDIMANLPASHYEQLSRQLPDHLHSVPLLETYYLTFNTREKPFDDVRVRKALSYVIDRERIVGSVLGQGQKAAYTFAPEIVAGFTPPTPEYQRMSAAEREETARQLLQEAGYSESNPLRFTYIYNPTDINRMIAIAIQAMWQIHLPVNVTLQSLEWATYLDMKRNGRYQVARALWQGDYNDASTMLGIHTPQHSNNSSFYNNERFNQLLSQARRTADESARNRLYAEAELVMADDVPVAPVYWNYNLYLVRPELGGVSVNNPSGRMYSREIYRVKKK
ncbi:peptide ABC transporter substrate-binding protein [Endozoicomonadaceae bacterium StTr2]